MNIRNKQTKLKFFEVVDVIKDINNYGHPTREKIIGKEGVILGIDNYCENTKCYVYISDLELTFGIDAKGLGSKNKFVKPDDFIIPFTRHIMQFISHAMGYDNMAKEKTFFEERFIPEFLSIKENYCQEILIASIEYSIENIKDINKKFFIFNEYPDDLVLEYLIKLKDFLIRSNTKH